ncbi:MAG: DUF4886 domain-containing protein [Clostridia bacterium]|nr:DUF4886 domain-containing protein [Clostridia bacterium]
MKILSIGNSFSQDAQRYLHLLAKSEGIDLICVNIYIGGCSLERHYNNIVSGEEAYEYELNGVYTGKKISIYQALLLEDWDYVTIQQVSNLSYNIESFFPFASALKEFIVKHCKNAKIYVHQTWGYETDSEKISITPFKSTEEMFKNVKDTYAEFASIIKADGIIPSGEAMLSAFKSGLKVYRDGFHASLGLGRYIIALVWYKFFTKKDIKISTFCSLDEEITPYEKEMAINIVNNIVK